METDGVGRPRDRGPEIGGAEREERTWFASSRSKEGRLPLKSSPLIGRSGRSPHRRPHDRFPQSGHDECAGYPRPPNHFCRKLLCATGSKHDIVTIGLDFLEKPERYWARVVKDV
jgi:hypothetical protein